MQVLYQELLYPFFIRAPNGPAVPGPEAYSGMIAHVPIASAPPLYHADGGTYPGAPEPVYNAVYADQIAVNNSSSNAVNYAVPVKRVTAYWDQQDVKALKTLHRWRQQVRLRS